MHVSSPRQLALALDHSASFAREDFLHGPSNHAALTLIESWPGWPTRVAALIGPAGSGKSHLAAIWAAQSGARFIAGRALDASSLPGALTTGALVIEDLAPGRFDEPALFHLLNMAREEDTYILLTASSALSFWHITLPDLASRLRAIASVTLAPPDDILLRAVIVKLFADRQLAVEESLIGYLATRIERSFHAARDAVEMIDREALRRKRPVNRALAADLFRERAP